MGYKRSKECQYVWHASLLNNSNLTWKIKCRPCGKFTELICIVVTPRTPHDYDLWTTFWRIGGRKLLKIERFVISRHARCVLGAQFPLLTSKVKGAFSHCRGGRGETLTVVRITLIQVWLPAWSQYLSALVVWDGTEALETTDTSWSRLGCSQCGWSSETWESFHESCSSPPSSENEGQSGIRLFFSFLIFDDHINKTVFEKKKRTGNWSFIRSMIDSASHRWRGWSEHPTFPECRPIGKRGIIGHLFFVAWMRDGVILDHDQIFLGGSPPQA